MGDTKKVWRCGVIANWGIGAMLVRALLGSPDISMHFVATTFDDTSEDRWFNAVANEVRRAGILLFHESQLSFELLEELLHKEDIDLLLTHAGRRILPWKVFSVPKLGSVNFHPSLLPLHRGPVPTWWVIHNRESVTGITSHYIDEGIDTGPMIAQVAVPVRPADTVITVIEALKGVVPSLLDSTLEKLRNPEFKPIPQNEALATYETRPLHDKEKSLI